MLIPILEFLLFLFLCLKNSENAVRRGRRPIIFLIFTIAMWCAVFFVGDVLKKYIINPFVYTEYPFLAASTWYPIIASFPSLPVIALGAFFSYRIVKYCKPGYEILSSAQANESVDKPPQLLNPANLIIVRESCILGAEENWQIFLNGTEAATLENGGSVTIPIIDRMNTIFAKNSSGAAITPLDFELSDGASAEILLKDNMLFPKFI